MNFIIIGIILFAVVALMDLVIFTYLHELAHKRALKKAGIKGTIKWNIRNNLKHIFATPLATCYFDDKKLKGLNNAQLKEIFLGGIKSDLFILIILSAISLIFFISLYFRVNLLLFYIVYAGLIALIFARLLHIFTNILYRNSDLDKFFKFYKDKSKSR